MDRAPGSAAGGESGAGPINAGAIAASSGGLAATLSAIHAGIRVPAMLHAFALNVNYNLWFLTMFPCWFWQEFAREDSAPRLRFLLGFAFTWFLGTCVLGTIFSSGGGRASPAACCPAPIPMCR